MPRSPNAQTAVELYNGLSDTHKWDAKTAWHGIARLLLSCEVWSRGWQPFKGVVVYREVNDFKTDSAGNPNAVLRRATALSDYLAGELGIERADLCQELAIYWRQPTISHFQPHNLVGHAFRSLTVNILQRFGSPGILYEEEVDPHLEFPGFDFRTRSKKPSIDIVARKGGKTVALMSTRWRFRHDRVDVVEEALAYSGAAHRHNPNCDLLAVVGEVPPNRLEKILSNCPPAHAHPPLSAAVRSE